MDLNEVRSRYLEFFKQRRHVIIPSASLVPENDSTTLFTGSGMQALMPYFLGAKHPSGKCLTDSQKCFRTGDIDEVGDTSHTTFFEMLGNWSFGDYFKEQQLTWLFEFLTNTSEGLGLNPEHLYVTVFSGDIKENLPPDTESALIWKKLFSTKNISAKEVSKEKEVQGGRIFYYGSEKNWWSRAGTPTQMPAGEPGGPDSEVFYRFNRAHNSDFGKYCHPNCGCGQFIEIGNSVFMQYVKNIRGSFDILPTHSVDFGGGLERLTMATQSNPDIIVVSHKPILEYLEKVSNKAYNPDTHEARWFRIISDHMKAAVFLIADGVTPTKTDRGYFVRRLIRRSVQYSDKLGIKSSGFASIVRPIAKMYQDTYPSLTERASFIEKTITEEENHFRVAFTRGLREFEQIASVTREISGENLFTLVTTYGFPLESIKEMAEGKNISLDEEGFRIEMEKHQALSRSGSEAVFKGGLADHSEETTRLHTAHHLLLKALQLVLGSEVKQRGSNITKERLRIDFSWPKKITEEEKREVERIINEKIKEDLPVIQSKMTLLEAENLGAEHEFGTKYPERVSVYSIGPKGATQETPQFKEAYSIEFCGGPHVTHTGAIGGTLHIKKEESISSGIRRIKAILTPF